MRVNRLHPRRRWFGPRPRRRWRWPTELFPTSVRASVAGWLAAAGVWGRGDTGLVVFGVIADVANRFESAVALTFLPTALAAGLFGWSPNPRATEPLRHPGRSCLNVTP